MQSVATQHQQLLNKTAFKAVFISEKNSGKIKFIPDLNFYSLSEWQCGSITIIIYNVFMLFILCFTLTEINLGVVCNFLVPGLYLP